jgi:hypothetical protein
MSYWLTYILQEYEDSRRDLLEAHQQRQLKLLEALHKVEISLLNQKAEKLHQKGKEYGSLVIVE